MSFLFAVNRRMRSILQNDTNHPIHLIRQEWEIDGFVDIHRMGKTLLAKKDCKLAYFMLELTGRNHRAQLILMEECVSQGFIKGVNLFGNGNRDTYRVKYGIKRGIKKGNGALMCQLMKTEFKNVEFNCGDFKNYIKAAIVAGDVDTFLVLLNNFRREKATCPEEPCHKFISDLPYILLMAGKDIEKFVPHIDISQIRPEKQIGDVLNNRNVDSIRFIFSKYNLTPYRKAIRIALRYYEMQVRRMLSDVIYKPKLDISEACLLMLAKTKYLTRVLSKKKRN